MRIGINFGDNDFYNTFTPFMKFLMAVIRNDPELSDILTKERIVDTFNSMSKSIYRLCQDRFYGDKIPKNYLIITVNDIYINEEIDKKLETYNSWANHSFFYIDTDNNQFDCW